MESTIKYDKIILIKEFNDKIKNVGDMFEIANILENSFLLRDAKTKIAIGVISFEDFDKHFVHEENFKGWSNWTPFNGVDGQNDVLYRTNRKRVQVKFITDKVRAESSCHEDDEFNLAFGLQIAYLRALNKVLIKRKNEYKEKLKSISNEIADNKNIMRRMLDSLYTI